MREYTEENEFEYEEGSEEVEFRKNKELLERLIEEFTDSNYYKQLSESQKRRAEFIINVYDDYSYNYDEPGIENWDEYSMRECCLDMLPRKITAEKETFECIAPVLESFFIFLYDKGIIKHGDVMAKEVMEIADEIVERSQESENWGMAKSFAMGSLRNNIISEPISREPKIGRNDPCTCGSGKKYKKCCGK